MKLSRFFIGLVLVLIGALVLVDNLNVVNVDWQRLWAFWPLFLIASGLSFIAHGTVSRVIVAVIIVLMIATVAYMMIRKDLPFWNKLDSEVKSQTLEQDYDANLKTATLNIDGKAGKYTIADVTTKLIRVETQSTYSSFNLDNNQSANSSKITLNQSDVVKSWWKPRHTNQATLNLNPNPIWKISGDFGASDINFDLSNYKVSDLTINAGASDIRLKMSDLLDNSKVIVKSGASSIKILLPNTVGASLDFNGGVSSVDFADSTSPSKHHYQSNNFASAIKKINIDVESGVSSVSVDWYGPIADF